MYVQQPFIDGKFTIIMFINMLRIPFVEAFPCFFLLDIIMSVLPVFLITACKSIGLMNQSLAWIVLFNPAHVTLWKHKLLVNAFFLDLMVSVDDDNSPQWRKLAWSQDCSMLACSYRFVMYWLTSKCLYTWL